MLRLLASATLASLGLLGSASADNIYVSSGAGDGDGTSTKPYYVFYSGADCSSTQLTDQGSLMPNTQYTFYRCNNAISHPFAVQGTPNGAYLPSPDRDEGLKDVGSITITTRDPGEYLWKCTNHDWMIGSFTVVRTDAKILADLESCDSSALGDLQDKIKC